MINLQENISSQTINKVQAQLESMETPITTFKLLMDAVRDMDFSAISDATTKTRYMEAKNKIEEYYKNYIYMDVYSGSEMYDEFINYIITLYAIIQTLVDGRLDIMDMAKQMPSVVNEFLDSFGFEIRRIFDDSTNVEIAQNIYGYVRKKGTVQLLSMLLNDMGFSDYQINEYMLNKIDDKYYITPDTVYSNNANFTVEPVRLSEVDDILRTLNEGQLDSLYNNAPYYHMPSKTSYFSINTILDMDQMIKTAIALDIVRQYLEKQDSMGVDVRIFAIDGYGEKLTFRDLCLGYWMVFDYLYGKTPTADQYPAILGFEGGDGIVGWNRTVTDPVIDIPKALALYDTLKPAAASSKDKFTRLEAIKKLFYRRDNGNRFFTYNEESYTILEEENEDFYNFILKKIDEIKVLAENEAKSSRVPGEMPDYTFDDKPYATIYDDKNDTYQYSPDLLNYNSAIVQANKFYMTFLTAFEQILYRYTKQIFPIKIYGTIAYLYDVYINMIIKYAKPYHAKLIETTPIFKIGGPKDLNESVVVQDLMLYDINMIIYTDVIKWRYDNPYDWRPGINDTFFEKIKDLPLIMSWNYTLEDQEHFNHRIDYDNYHVDNYKENHIYEDMTIKCDTTVNNYVLSSSVGLPFAIYPSVAYYNDNIYEAITKNDDSSYTNNLDSDLILVTDNYAEHAFKLSEIQFVNQKLDSSAKFGVLTLDMCTCTVYNGETWRVRKIPSVNNILIDNEMPAADLSEYFEDFNDLVNVDLDYKAGYQNFLKFFVYVPARSTFYLPKVNFVGRSLLY